MDKKKVFTAGLRDSCPFGIAFIFLYLTVGALGSAHSLSLTQTVSTTLFIFSTPLQYLLLQSYHDGWVLIPLILAMNARFLLMSAYLSPYFKEQKIIKLSSSLILIVPSVFAACKSKFLSMDKYYYYYFLGVGIPIFLSSLICTFVGYEASAYLNIPSVYKFIFMVLPLQFTCLAGKHWPHLYETLSYWGGFILLSLLYPLLHSYNLLITPFIVGGAAILLEELAGKKK